MHGLRIFQGRLNKELSMLKGTKQQQSKTKLDIVDVEKRHLEQGVYFLQHETKAQYLPAILKSRFLIPRKQQTNANYGFGGNSSVSYLAPYRDFYRLIPDLSQIPTAGTLTHGGKGCPFNTPLRISVLLLFSMQLLNDDDNYYANDGWKYGVESWRTAKAFKTGDVIIEAGELWEICFKNPINLAKYLVEIWVHPDHENWLRSLLQSNKVDSYWQKKIVAYEFFPHLSYQPSVDRHLLSRNQLWITPLELSHPQVIEPVYILPIYGVAYINLPINYFRIILPFIHLQ